MYEKRNENQKETARNCTNTFAPKKVKENILIHIGQSTFTNNVGKIILISNNLRYI